VKGILAVDVYMYTDEKREWAGMPSDQTIREWFVNYRQDVFHYLFYKMGSSDVEDLVQEVFIRAIKGFGGFQNQASPKTWLLSIARNLANDEFRKAKWKMWQRSIPFEERHQAVTEHSPEDIIQFSEETRALYEAISRLKPKYRDVIILRGIKDLSVKETSMILSWTENKVGMTYHRARKALENELRRSKVWELNDLTN
jgi:RNA polymerase sigma-70 factor, ECF subfamily